MFEIRGVARQRRGQRLSHMLEADGVVFSYAGLDGLLRRTRISCSPKPDNVYASELHFKLHLGPKAHKDFFLNACCDLPPAAPVPGPAKRPLCYYRNPLRSRKAAPARSRPRTRKSTNG